MHSLPLNVFANLQKKNRTKFIVTWPYPTFFYQAGIVDKVYTA